MNNNNLIKPKKIQKGDTIGIISPAGNVFENADWNKVTDFFNKRGYNVKIAEHAKDANNYLAGTDQNRAKDLTDFFEDPQINAVICSRGGYGVHRILNLLDYKIIKQNPKIFVGYSDITALHSAFLKKSNLVTFHGPLAISDFGNDKNDKYTIDNFFEILEGKTQIPYTYKNPCEYTTIINGKANGALIGGNLAMISSLAGTDFQYNFNDKILLIEDLQEPLYKIDRMLMQLKLSGVFTRIKGVLVGQFSDIEEQDKIINLLKELLENYEIPVGYGFPASHEKIKFTLPFGVEYQFNSKNGTLMLLENYLSV